MESLKGGYFISIFYERSLLFTKKFQMPISEEDRVRIQELRELVKHEVGLFSFKEEMFIKPILCSFKIHKQESCVFLKK